MRKYNRNFRSSALENQIFQEKNKEIRTLKKEISNLKKYYSKDYLTNTLNKSNGIRRLQYEINKSLARNCPTTIAFIDVDDMKSINDKFGHCSGDKLLFTLGKIITSNIRKEDFVFRFGGDEFVIVFSNSDVSNSLKICTRIKNSLNDVNEKNEFPFSICISCGISQYNGIEKIGINELLKKADNAMYENKRDKKIHNGR